MRTLLNVVMMSCASIVLMTVLALGMTKAYAQEAQPIDQENAAQNELVDLFFAAAKTGNLEVIDEFLKNGFPVDVRNQTGYTALMMASYYGHQDIVVSLLSNGANRCLRDNKGNTALMGAIFKLEWSIVKQLRQVDCDIEAKKQGLKTAEDFVKVLGQEQKWYDLTTIP